MSIGYQAISFSDKIMFNVLCVMSLYKKTKKKEKTMNKLKYKTLQENSCFNYLIVCTGIEDAYKMQIRFSPDTYEWHL